MNYKFTHHPVLNGGRKEDSTITANLSPTPKKYKTKNHQLFCLNLCIENGAERGDELGSAESVSVQCHFWSVHA